MMRTGEHRRDQRLLWVGVGVAVVVVGLFAFLTGLYSNGTATPSTAFYAPFFPIGFPWVGGIFSLFFLAYNGATAIPILAAAALADAFGTARVIGGLGLLLCLAGAGVARGGVRVYGEEET